MLPIMTQTMSSDGKNPLRVPVTAPPPSNVAPVFEVPPPSNVAPVFEVRLLVTATNYRTPGELAESLGYTLENEMRGDVHVRALSCQEAEVCDVCGCLTVLHTHSCAPEFLNPAIAESIMGKPHCVICGGTEFDWQSRCPVCFKAGLVS